jgi:hypothetical protein
MMEKILVLDDEASLRKSICDAAILGMVRRLLSKVASLVLACLTLL